MNGRPQWEMDQSERAHNAIWYDEENNSWNIGEKIIQMFTVVPDFVKYYATTYSKDEVPNFNENLPWFVRKIDYKTKKVRKGFNIKSTGYTALPTEENGFEMRTISPKIEFFVESMAPLSPPLATFTSAFEMINIEIKDEEEEEKKKKKSCTLL